MVQVRDAPRLGKVTGVWYHSGAGMKWGVPSLKMWLFNRMQASAQGVVE
jgi:hypothetical protein